MRILIIVDMQNDFVDPAGALYVSGAEAIVPIINDLIPQYDYVVTTQDWHPKGHVSFEKYPQHCVANTWGAELHPGLQLPSYSVRLLKGQDPKVDSPSGFQDDAGRQTGLMTILTDLTLEEDQEYLTCEIDVVGVAIRVCVKATAIDGANERLSISFLEPACKDFGEREGTEAAIQEMVAAGVKRVTQLPE